MEWSALAIVLQTTPFGEGDTIAFLLTAEHGPRRGLVRGGAARRNRSVWDVGNIVQTTWSGRSSEQLGRFAGELVDAPMARLLDDALLLAAIPAACVTAAGALAEHVVVSDAYDALLLFLARLVNGDAPLAAFVRWEVALLRDLGFGLDMERCALTGSREGLGYVSPRTGRAVAEGAATQWAERLLRLPRFLVDGDDRVATIADVLAGLRLTGHFLSRDAFGQRHQALPDARTRLVDMLASRLLDE